MEPIKDATPRWAFLRRYRVQAHGITYLTRFALLQTPLFGIWLHRIHRKDPGGSPHNHPWNFRSLVLHGGYVEKLWSAPHTSTRYLDGQRRTHKRWSFKSFRQDWAHQIETVENNTITLVFVGRHHGEWGFFTWQGYQEWDEAPTLKSHDYSDWRFRTPNPYRIAGPTTYRQWATPERQANLLPVVQDEDDLDALIAQYTADYEGWFQ